MLPSVLHVWRKRIQASTDVAAHVLRTEPGSRVEQDCLPLATRRSRCPNALARYKPPTRYLEELMRLPVAWQWRHRWQWKVSVVSNPLGERGDTSQLAFPAASATKNKEDGDNSSSSLINIGNRLPALRLLGCLPSISWLYG